MVLRMIGVALALVLICVSTAINARFGYSLGGDDVDGVIYAAASIAADGFKAVSLIFAAWAIASRQWLAAIACSVLFLVGTSYSLVSAVGFAGSNRAEASTQKASPQNIYDRTKAQYERDILKLDGFGVVQTSAEVSQKLQLVRQHPRWKATSGCTDITAKKSRGFCRRYGLLLIEHARSKEAEKLKVSLSKARAQLDRLEGELGGSSGEHQANLVSRLLGTSLGKTELALIILMALLVEIGSGLGLFVALHSGRSTKVEKEEGAVGNFVLDVVEQDESSRVSVGDLYESYEAWCRQSDVERIGVVGFSKEIVSLMKDIGLDVEEEGGQTWICGVAV